MKALNPTENIASNELAANFRDLSRQLDKAYNEKVSQKGFVDESRILGIIKELVKEQNSHENTANSARTFR